MARNKIKFSGGVAFIVLLIGANILLLLPQKHTARINYFFVRITSPIVNLIPRSDPSKNDTVEKSEYDQLLADYKTLQARHQAIIDVNRNLSHIRNNPPMPVPAIVMANVSKLTIEGQRNEIIINRGWAHGLKKGQYVISAGHDLKDNLTSSVIGTISELSKTMSRVRLITDATHHISVDIWRDGINLGISGQLRGNNKMQAKIPLISRKQYDLKDDDFVFAKRKSGFLETPLVIGKITEIIKDEQYPLLWDITVTPIINIKSLTDVGVIVIDLDTSSDEGDE